ncbi:ribonuclease E inhibitor RraB [Rhodanobacter sp. C05]|uniref:ribonuclease E inhibitor RraB n=1 Tax=Rhodanobacter sp. C05 TaxID=1945855 RepID=UPI000987860F|nr:ribonuclease E inhibitor RraB [Rhodanobacter sp. C05]OOG38362.1 hypothetical protein B0E51_14395 [Rhodanobacter sp. C05]
MKLVTTLMETAAADTDVLRSLDRNGDRFSVFRNVDFLLVATDAEKADLVASFINDHGYGKAVLQEPASILVTINMPVEQPVVLCVSGFFACLAQLFGVEYDGWGCVAQAQA